MATTTPLSATLDTWRCRVRERFLKLFPPARSPLPPSWPIDPDQARRVVIRWPTRYEWEGAKQWMRDLLRGLRRHVRVERAPLAQPYGGIVLIELVRDGKACPIALDYSDYMDRIDHDCLERVPLYFKMQHLREGYGDPRIVPGGYINPAPDFYHYVTSLRSRAARAEPQFDVYGRFGLQFAGAIRRRAVELLRDQTRFRYEGSLALVRYHRSLEEAARARICIDLPGNGDFCFRLIDYLGIGACVVAPRHRTSLHVPLEDRKHIVYARPDLADLVELCAYYLDHDAERRAIIRNSRDYYDRYLHRDQLSAYYLWAALRAR